MALFPGAFGKGADHVGRRSVQMRAAVENRYIHFILLVSSGAVMRAGLFISGNAADSVFPARPRGTRLLYSIEIVIVTSPFPRSSFISSVVLSVTRPSLVYAQELEP